MLDRIDLHIEVPAVPFQELRGRHTGSTPAELRDLCPLDPAGEGALEMAVRRMGLSARAPNSLHPPQRIVG